MDTPCNTDPKSHPPTAVEEFLDLLARLLAKRWLQQQRETPSAADPCPADDQAGEE